MHLTAKHMFQTLLAGLFFIFLTPLAFAVPEDCESANATNISDACKNEVWSAMTNSPVVRAITQALNTSFPFRDCTMSDLQSTEFKYSYSDGGGRIISAYIAFYDCENNGTMASGYSVSGHYQIDEKAIERKFLFYLMETALTP